MLNVIWIKDDYVVWYNYKFHYFLIEYRSILRFQFRYNFILIFYSNIPISRVFTIGYIIIGYIIYFTIHYTYTYILYLILSWVIEI